MKKRALISVYDKRQILEFAEGLIELGWEIISTGGTESLLRQKGLPVVSVADFTDFPEILGGRVKTLHPHIHGGILNRRQVENDQREIEDQDIHSIDMVVNNLYPFEESVKNPDAEDSDIIENIDIGGPSMIRAAAKNYKDVIIVTEISDYDVVLNALRAGKLDEVKRQKLAAKAFSLTAFYDATIAHYFNENVGHDFPHYLVHGYRFEAELRYGENPHQKASLYQHPLKNHYPLDQIHGKDLSYNNYNDIQAAVDLLQEFDQPGVVAIKHANPCGVAVGQSLAEAYQKAYATDTSSIYGGILALNREVDEETALKMSDIFLEVIIAPSFSQKALTLLTQKKKLRLIVMPKLGQNSEIYMEAGECLDGLLLQEKDRLGMEKEVWSNKTSRELTDQEDADLEFAWLVAKHINSNGVVVAKNGATLALGHGEVRRVWALEKALERSEQDLSGAVVASDGFFFEDTIKMMEQYGLKAVIQPGGSIQDEKVINLAEDSDISLIMTGVRHFKH